MEYTGEQLVLGAPGAAGRTEKEHLARYRFASAFVSGKKVLDIACGTGYGSASLKKAGAISVDGVDISEKAVSFAQGTYSETGIRFVTHDAQTYRNPTAYDVIVSFETIEHVMDYRQALKNLYESLKPGGTLIMSTPNRPVTSPRAKTINDKPENEFHIREFTISEISDAVREAGLLLDEKGMFGQCKPRKFENRILQKINRIWQRWTSQSGPDVQPLKRIGVVKYVVMVASKPL